MKPKEQFPAPPNKSLGITIRDRIIYRLRPICDMQVKSVLMHLQPWLASLYGKVLEVGCGDQPYRHMIPDRCEYVGLDWDQAKEYFDYQIPDTVYYDGNRFPFEDAVFDNLFHTEVLEHIFDYSLYLSECCRVLKAGGKMFFSVPFQARYHYIPNDFWRFTPSSLELLLKNAGFENIEIHSRGNDITVASYKSLSLVYRWLSGKLFNKLLGIIAAPVGALCLVLGQLSLVVNIGSCDDCLGYNVSASKSGLYQPEKQLSAEHK